MHSIESSIIFSFIIIFVANLISFTINVERKISKYVDTKYVKELEQYSKNGEKKYNPENVLRIITNIENLKKEIEDGHSKQ